METSLFEELKWRKLQNLSKVLDKYGYYEFTREVESKWPPDVVCTKSGGSVAVSSGTVALEVALKVLGLTQGTVLVPPTVPMVSWAVQRAGAMVGEVPCNQNLVMSYDQIGERFNNYRGIIYVATGGIVDEDFLKIIALREKGIKVILDLSHAHGGCYREEAIEAYPVDAVCWSFFATKTLNCGEGGMVWFRNEDHVAEARMLVNAGKERGEGTVRRSDAYNYRMSEFNAAILSVEIDYCERIYYVREVQAGRYRHMGKVKSIVDEIEGLTSTYYKYPVRVPEGKADEIEEIMRKAGFPLPGRVHSKNDNYGRPWADPMTSKAFESHVCLPIGPHVSDDMIEKVSSLFLGAIGY